MVTPNAERLSSACVGVLTVPVVDNGTEIAQRSRLIQSLDNRIGRSASDVDSQESEAGQGTATHEPAFLRLQFTASPDNVPSMAACSRTLRAAATRVCDRQQCLHANGRGDGLTMRYAGVAIILSLLHLLLAMQPFAMPGSALAQALQIGIFAAAVIAVWRRRGLEAGIPGGPWGLLALALLFQLGWACVRLGALLLPAWAQQLEPLASLLSGLHIVPMLYLIASASSVREPALARILDACMALMLAVLLFILIQDTGGDSALANPEAKWAAIWHIDAIDVSLVMLMGLRLAGARRVGRRHVYWAATVFLSVNALAAAIYNRAEMHAPVWWGPVVIDGAYLAVLLAAWRPMPGWLRGYAPPAQLARTVNAFAPVAIAFAVLVLALFLTKAHFVGGALTVLLAAVLYGLRVAIIQSGYERDRRLVDLKNRQLRLQLKLDPLTGIANRGALDAHLRHLLSTGANCTLMMIDIDYFKQFNDTQGHVQGDQCLALVATALRTALRRSTKMVARFGGEEFVVIVPHADQVAVENLANRLLTGVSDLRIPHPASPLGQVTVSIGVATYDCEAMNGSGDPATALLQAADHALYQAKADGRNRIRYLVEQPLPVPDL